MAAFVHQYVDQLLRKQQVAAEILGSDIMHTGPEIYSLNLTLLTLIGVLMKAMHDKGVVLDPEWQTRLNTALDGTWPDWIVHQTAPPA